MVIPAGVTIIITTIIITTTITIGVGGTDRPASIDGVTRTGASIQGAGSFWP
jgi:hypothetical protein